MNARTLGPAPVPAVPRPGQPAACRVPRPREPAATQCAGARWPYTGPARAVRAAVRGLLLFPVLRLCAGRLVVVGAQRLPETPVVLVANHASHADTAAILRALPRRLRGRLAPAAASDYFFCRPLRAALTAGLLGAFAFPRHGRRGIERAAGELTAGRSVLLFPQGTRTGGPFRAGVGLLAAGGATVVPVGLAGTAAVLPKGRRRPRRGRIAIVFGHPRTYGADTGPGVAAADLERRVGDLAAQAAGAAAGDSSRGDTPLPAPATTTPYRPRRRLYTRAGALARSPRGLPVVFVWSLAEALIVPVIPDLGIGLLAAAAPRRFLPLALAGAAGSVVGGAAAYGLGAAGLVPPLPLVTAAMADTARILLAEAGAAALWAQPLSSVPYKAFAYAAAGQGADVGPFLAVTALGRGARMLAVAGVLAGLGWALRRWCPIRRAAGVYAGAAGVLLALFVLGLAGTIARSA